MWSKLFFFSLNLDFRALSFYEKKFFQILLACMHVSNAYGSSGFAQNGLIFAILFLVYYSDKWLVLFTDTSKRNLILHIV